MGKYFFEKSNWMMIIVLLIIIYSLPVMAVKVKGTPHDLSSKGNTVRICQTCHISKSTSEAKSLMAEEVNKDAYSKIQDILGLSSSLFCTQCHDGTISHRNIGNTGQGVSSNMGRKKGSITLGDHPVNIDYPQADIDFESNPSLKLYGRNDNEIRCNTCHDPHKAGTGSFLRKKKGLCIDCHHK